MFSSRPAEGRRAREQPDSPGPCPPGPAACESLSYRRRSCPRCSLRERSLGVPHSPGTRGGARDGTRRSGGRGGGLTQDPNLQAPQSCLDGSVDLQAPGEVGLDDARAPAVKPLWGREGSGPAPSLPLSPSLPGPSAPSSSLGPSGAPAPAQGAQSFPAAGRSPISLASCSNLLRLRLMRTMSSPLLASCGNSCTSSGLHPSPTAPGPRLEPRAFTLGYTASPFDLFRRCPPQPSRPGFILGSSCLCLRQSWDSGYA